MTSAPYSKREEAWNDPLLDGSVDVLSSAWQIPFIIDLHASNWKVKFKQGRKKDAVACFCGSITLCDPNMYVSGVKSSPYEDIRGREARKKK